MLSIDDKAQAFTTVTAEEVAARAAIMDVPIFPNLERELVKVFGANSAIVLHQLVYWFGKPKMQKRRWLYKTFKEWRDERGLGRKAVDSARRRLARLGVLEEKHGPNKRVHYRVDWVQLAEMMKLEVTIPDDPDGFDLPDDFDVPEGPEESLHPIGDSDSDEDDILGGKSLHPKGDSDSLHPKGDSSHCTLKGTDLIVPLEGQSNTGDYTGASSVDYLAVDSSLQDAPESLSRSGAPETINDFEDLEEPMSSPPIKDKRHSQDSGTPPKKTAASERVDEPKAPPLPDDTNLLAEVREVLDPESGKWSPEYAELIRKNYGSCKAYSPEGLARNLEAEVDLPFAGRKDDLAECLRYLFWEWSNVPQGAGVAA